MCTDEKFKSFAFCFVFNTEEGDSQISQCPF